MKVTILILLAICCLESVAQPTATIRFLSVPGEPRLHQVEAEELVVKSRFSVIASPESTFQAGVILKNAYNDFSESIGFVDGFTKGFDIKNQLNEVVGKWATHYGTVIRGDIAGTDLIIGVIFTANINIGDLLKFSSFSAVINDSGPTNPPPYNVIIADPQGVIMEISAVDSVPDIPSITIMVGEEGVAELSFKGVLYESEDLIDWRKVEPQPESPLVVVIAQGPSRKFYQSRSE